MVFRVGADSFSVASQILFVAHVQQSLLGLFNFFLGTTNCDLARAAVRWRELDLNSTTFFHNGLDKLAAGADKRLVVFGRNFHIFRDDADLQAPTQKKVCQIFSPNPLGNLITLDYYVRFPKKIALPHNHLFTLIITATTCQSYPIYQILTPTSKTK